MNGDEQAYITSSAVALVLFNRPDTTQYVLSQIALVKPKRLYLIGDGARENKLGEVALVEQTRRDVLRLIQWNCKVIEIYSRNNLGCKQRIISGISQVFLQEDFAIILEDDCVPTPAFFKFCDESKEAERQNRRIFSISGSNFTGIQTRPGCFESDYALMWGWATWADRWNLYQEYPKDSTTVVRGKWKSSLVDQLYWFDIFRKISQRKRESVWDYQWILTHWRHNAFSLRPTANLVTNIGFGLEATHTTGKNRFQHVETPTDVQNYHSLDRDVDAMIASNNADRLHWAMINWKSIAYMYFPLIKKIIHLSRKIQ